MDSSNSELVQLWDRPGLSWDIRTMLEPALKDFENDPGKSNTKNFDSLLSRLDSTSREHIESLSAKKPGAFYGKILAALVAERELLGSKSRVPDSEFDSIAAGFQEPTTMRVSKPATTAPRTDDDDMDLAGYSVPAETSEYNDACRFVDHLLEAISPDRK
jgi:hypothetical protein